MFAPTGQIHRLIEIFRDVEAVVNHVGLRKDMPCGGGERIPHVHADAIDTCSIAGITNGSTGQVTPYMDRIALDPRTKLRAVKMFARIAETTREQYRRTGGTYPTDGLAWADTAAKLYRQSWESDRNELVVAWAKANPPLPLRRSNCRVL